MLGIFLTGADSRSGYSGLKIFNERGVPCSQAECQLIEENVQLFASRQLYVQDLSKQYDYWFREFR